MQRARKVHGKNMGMPLFGDRAQARAWRSEAGNLEWTARYYLGFDPSWASVLMEEVGEAMTSTGPELGCELIQVAAMAVCMHEAREHQARIKTNGGE